MNAAHTVVKCRVEKPLHFYAASAPDRLLVPSASSARMLTLLRSCTRSPQSSPRVDAKIVILFPEILQTNIAKFREKIAHYFAKHVSLVAKIWVTSQIKSDKTKKCKKILGACKNRSIFENYCRSGSCFKSNRTKQKKYYRY
jgi:hypothetical protein